MEIDFSKFEDKIGVSFKDKALLRQAFVHRSYINENPSLGLSHNERLEFLGDAVLELSVTDYLYKKYPDKTEGDLTSYRAALVNAVILGEAAVALGMNDYLLLSKGEMKDTGKARHYILANVFESVVGALYLDRGYDAADTFIANTLFQRLDSIVKAGLYKDAKSHIQEKAQQHVGVTPSYKVMKEAGPDHDKSFVVGIYFGAELIAEGRGKSKQEAEQKAASAALSTKRWS
ncbi:ribonuclease III [Candidatus Parcubacteria bacterium]|nr:ribonuclease III [Candidatus Parcubacteria bacterium]